ncbi:pseudouridine synthase [Oceanivirga salmonicida]|uniref:pseudouridine synthase n=1 Tax=Oceanivirga salmonicida TaxID=1769291 RepID=UPI0012E29894|nr:pseudouridine synthase [Oceanivirga salmonicida]
MRLDKFLANSGIGTRSNVRNLIKSKKVKVNGNTVSEISFSINENNDIITVSDKKVEYKPYIYIMLNKPSGYISATEDKKYKVVTELLNSNYSTYNLFPLGRLDIDTVGLLILTNDGKLSHELLSPKKHIPKTYYVETKNIIDDIQIKKLEIGVDIGDYITKSDAKLEILTDKTCHLTITEGKFHQIKKMFLAVGNEVIFLKRVKMNKLELDNTLDYGEYRELSVKELESLKGK